jgi:toxin HigB-1
VIASYGDTTTHDIHQRKDSKAARRIPKEIWPAARRKLDMIHYARSLADLNAPGARLEKMKGDWAGYYSVRVNDQYRVVFKFWDNGTAEDATILDYH